MIIAKQIIHTIYYMQEKWWWWWWWNLYLQWWSNTSCWQYIPQSRRHYRYHSIGKTKSSLFACGTACYNIKLHLLATLEEIMWQSCMNSYVLKFMLYTPENSYALKKLKVYGKVHYLPELISERLKSMKVFQRIVNFACNRESFPYMVYI